MTINRREFLAGGAGVGAVSILLAACGGSGSSSSNSGGGSKTTGSTGSTTDLVEAVAGLPTSFAFDANGNGYENMEFNANTTACLLRTPYIQSKRTPTALTQDTYKYEGVLAESYDVSPDGLEYTFHLRKGVVSQQGNPFTADDVLYSYERKYNSTSVTPFVSSPAITDPSKQFVKVDDNTVKITVQRKSDGFTLLALLANVTAEIYDSTYLKKMATKSDPYAVKLSGTKGNFGYGAYTLDSYTPGQQLILVSNPHFALGEPKIKKITQRVVADAGTRANVLKQGDVDVAVQLLPADVADLAKDSNIDTFEVENTNDYTWLTLNTATAPFNDVAVRQAFQLAIPYDQIIKNVYKGRADKMTGWLDPTAPGYSAQGLVTPEYNPDKAKSILKGAGHSSVSCQLLISDAVPDLEQVAVQIRSAASAAGFNVTIVQQPAATAGANQSAGKYQAVMIRDMAISLSPPYELLLAYTKGSPLNSGKWENNDYYAATTAGIEAGDPFSTAAGLDWAKAMAVALDQVPQVSIARVQPLMAFRKNVTGFAHRSDNCIDFSVVSKS